MEALTPEGEDGNESSFMTDAMDDELAGLDVTPMTTPIRKDVIATEGVDATPRKVALQNENAILRERLRGLEQAHQSLEGDYNTLLQERDLRKSKGVGGGGGADPELEELNRELERQEQLLALQQAGGHSGGVQDMKELSATLEGESAALQWIRKMEKDMGGDGALAADFVDGVDVKGEMSGVIAPSEEEIGAYLKEIFSSACKGDEAGAVSLEELLSASDAFCPVETERPALIHYIKQGFEKHGKATSPLRMEAFVVAIGAGLISKTPAEENLLEYSSSTGQKVTDALDFLHNAAIAHAAVQDEGGVDSPLSPLSMALQDTELDLAQALDGGAVTAPTDSHEDGQEDGHEEAELLLDQLEAEARQKADLIAEEARTEAAVVLEDAKREAEAEAARIRERAKLEIEAAMAAAQEQIKHLARASAKEAAALKRHAEEEAHGIREESRERCHRREPDRVPNPSPKSLDS